MASRFSPSDIGTTTPVSSFSTPLLFNGYQCGTFGTLSGSGEENCSSGVRKPAQEIARADIDWRYVHEVKVLREFVWVESIKSTPPQPFVYSNMLYPTHGHAFGYEQRNPFLGHPANASAVNSLAGQRQESHSGNFIGHENEVFSNYASRHNIDLRGIGTVGNMQLCRWSQANFEGNFPIMKLPEADFDNKLTAVCRPECEIPGNIPLRHCPEGSNEGKMPCSGSVTSANVQIFHCPQASMMRKLPSYNHSVSEILVKANIHDQIEEKGGRKENLANASAAEVLYGSVNSESHLLHQLNDIEKFSPGRSVVSNGTVLPENSKKRKRKPFRVRKAMKKKAHSALETQSSKPCEKSVEELRSSFSKVGSTSLCSVDAHKEGKKHNAEGGSSIVTKGIKKVKDATKKFKDVRKKVKNVKRVSKRRSHDRKFWCEMCNIEGLNETLMSIHRNGKKHLKMLRKNHGAVIVVSSNQIDKETIVKRG